MGDDYSFKGKNIKILAPSFFKHNNSFVANVGRVGEINVVCGRLQKEKSTDNRFVFNDCYNFCTSIDTLLAVGGVFSANACRVLPMAI